MRAGLTVGGIEVEVGAPRGPIEAILTERYSPFLGAVVDPVCSIAFEATGSVKGLPNPPMATVKGGAGPGIALEHPDFSATIDLEGEGTIVTASDPFTIDHTFRILFGLLAPRHDAVMLHACGIITGGIAHVFAGQSGAGKSTLASLAGHRPLLSDEHVLVRRHSDGWHASSTPFWGSYAQPGASREAPLHTLWSLRQWPTVELRPGGPILGLRTVVSNAVLPSPDPDIKRAVFDIAVDVAADVPAAELRFTPTPDVWEEIDARAVA